MGRKIELTAKATKNINKFFKSVYILPGVDCYRVYDKFDDRMLSKKETLQEAVDFAYLNEKAVKE